MLLGCRPPQHEGTSWGCSTCKPTEDFTVAHILMVLWASKPIYPLLWLVLMQTFLGKVWKVWTPSFPPHFRCQLTLQSFCSFQVEHVDVKICLWHSGTNLGFGLLSAYSNHNPSLHSMPFFYLQTRYKSQPLSMFDCLQLLAGMSQVVPFLNLWFTWSFALCGRCLLGFHGANN